MPRAYGAEPGGRLSGRGKGVANKQISQQEDLYLQICTRGGVLVPGGAGTLRGRCP
jgi:hypothetical protein